MQAEFSWNPVTVYKDGKPLAETPYYRAYRSENTDLSGSVKFYEGPLTTCIDPAVPDGKTLFYFSRCLLPKGGISEPSNNVSVVAVAGNPASPTGFSVVSIRP